MNSYFDKLNLNPQERRLVVGVGVIVFIILNFLFVWPHFQDWKVIRQKTAEAKSKLDKFQAEIAQVPTYEARLKELEATGTRVASEVQDLQLQRVVDEAARATGVYLGNYNPNVNTGGSSEFFEERSLSVTVSSGNKELVDFLVKLASSSSIIRVRNLTLAPDPSSGHTKLKGTILFTASYQKSSNSATSDRRKMTAKN